MGGRWFFCDLQHLILQGFICELGITPPPPLEYTICREMRWSWPFMDVILKEWKISTSAYKTYIIFIEKLQKLITNSLELRLISNVSLILIFLLECCIFSYLQFFQTIWSIKQTVNKKCWCCEKHQYNNLNLKSKVATVKVTNGTGNILKEEKYSSKDQKKIDHHIWDNSYFKELRHGKWRCTVRWIHIPNNIVRFNKYSRVSHC